jgi:hypothetical protein
MEALFSSETSAEPYHNIELWELLTARTIAGAALSAYSAEEGVLSAVRVRAT